MRQNSMDDVHLDQFLKISNYEDTVKQLDIYYGLGLCATHITIIRLKTTSPITLTPILFCFYFQLKGNCLNIKVQSLDCFPFCLRILKSEAFGTAFIVLRLFGVDFLLLLQNIHTIPNLLS